MKRITLSLPAPYVGLRPFEEKDALVFFGREAHVRDLLEKFECKTSDLDKSPLIRAVRNLLKNFDHKQKETKQQEHKQRFISVIGASGSGKSSLVRAGLIPALHRGALASAGYRWNVHITKPGDAPLHNLVEKLTEDSRWIDGGDRAASMASLRAQFAINPLALAEQYQRRAGLFNDEALLLVVDQFEEIFRYRQQNIDEAEAFIKLLLRSVSESEQVPIYVVITMRSDFLGHCVAFFGLPEAINSGLYLTPRLRPEQLKSIIASPLALIGSDIDPVLVNRLINTLEGDDELPILEHALLRMWNHARKNGRNRIEEQDFVIICKLREGENDTTSPKLAFAIGNHAAEIYDRLTPQQQAIAQQIFPALVERRENRDVRRPQTFQQLTDLMGQHDQDSLMTVIDAFRQNGAGFLLPSAAEIIDKETLIDISHESFFRQWYLYKQWLDEEALDATELKEWHYRWERHQKTGSGWLDDNDSHRASQWLERTGKYHNPQQWVVRYLEQDDFQSVKTFIQTSQQIAQEKQQAETKRLEKEAALQRQLAEHAEKQKQQAEAFARSSRKKSIWAMGAALVAILLLIISLGLWQHAQQEKTRADWEKDRATQAKKNAQKLARDTHATALIAAAENVALATPDQSILIGLAAQEIGNYVKIEAHLRSAFATFTFRDTLQGHEGSVHGAQFSPDGKTILTRSGDKTVRLWDAASGKALHVLQGHEGSVDGARFSPDGNTILTSSEDKTARLWVAASGKALHVLQGHEEIVMGAQFSPDGNTILTYSSDIFSNDKTARLWDAASGKALHVLQGHEGSVDGAQFSPDGKTILTRSRDKTVRLWDTASGKALHVLQDHERSVHGAQFSPDGKTILTVSKDKTARLWACDVCRSIDEIAAELKRRVGRELTDEERHRFGVADIVAQEQ